MFNKSENMIISCVNRAPGTCPDIFRDKVAGVFVKFKDNMAQVVCGDLNVDLLNPNQSINTGTNRLVVITKSSRTIKDSAML